VIDNLRKSKPQAQEIFPKSAAASNNSNSLSFKYSDLLKVQRELPLPQHFKILTELNRFIDDAIGFLRQKKMQPNG
jgi:hypothetical protein